YRDTWTLGVHSYLTYLRDRLLLSRELLATSGSILVQINDRGLHHLRELLDEVFGAENHVGIITFKTTSTLGERYLGTGADYLLWYAREFRQLKFRRLFGRRTRDDDVGNRYTRVQLRDGSRRVMTTAERDNIELLPPGSEIYRHDNLTSQGFSEGTSGP